MTNTLRRPRPEPLSWDYRSEQKRLERERTEAWQAHREQIEDGKSIPTFTVPDHRIQIRPRGTCQFCRSSIFDLRLPAVDLEHPHVSYRGSIICMLCGRDGATLVIGGEQPKLPAEPPKRGRPAGSTGSRKPQGDNRPYCQRCDRNRVKWGRSICFECKMAAPLPPEHPIWVLLSRLEPAGQRVSATDLRRALGNCSYDNVRCLIRFARRRGYPITSQGHQGYVLETP
jgi:biotin operon repressor